MVQRDPAGERAFIRKFVHDTDKLTSFKIDGIVAFFEVIEFLENRDGDRYIIVLKTIEGIVVIKNNRSVQDEYFFLGLGFCHRFRFG
jgi:hypothetical protein